MDLRFLLTITRTHMLALMIMLSGTLAITMIGCEQFNANAQPMDTADGSSSGSASATTAANSQNADADSDGDDDSVIPQAPTPTAIESGNMVTNTSYLPTGDRKTSALMLKRSAPAAVQLGAPFTYDMVVTNISANALSEVKVTSLTDAIFTVSETDPEVDVEDDDKLVWEIGTLEQGQSKTIKVSGIANEIGMLSDCATASYVPYNCLKVAVVEPELRLVVSAPEQVLKCELIPLRFVVTNSGSGDATNVLITNTLPEGLVESTTGKRTIIARIPRLKPGESKQFASTAEAVTTGKFANTATATADGDIKIASATNIDVRSPQLTLEASASKKIFLGRDLPYTIKVSNIGDGDARDTVVQNILPGNVEVVSATTGVTRDGDTLNWALGTIKAGESQELSLVVHPTAISKLKNVTSVGAFCAEAQSVTTETEAAGIPAVLLEVIDTQDPIEVGTKVTYQITVTNQGSSPGTGILIQAALEDAAEYVAAGGATDATVVGQKISFAQLESLPPKATATWTITAKAVAAGDVRFKVTMNSDQIGRDVEETEATNFYE